MGESPRAGGAATAHTESLDGIADPHCSACTGHGRRRARNLVPCIRVDAPSSQSAAPSSDFDGQHQHGARVEQPKPSPLRIRLRLRPGAVVTTATSAPRRARARRASAGAPVGHHAAAGPEGSSSHMAAMPPSNCMLALPQARRRCARRIAGRRTSARNRASPPRRARAGTPCGRRVARSHEFIDQDVEPRGQPPSVTRSTATCARSALSNGARRSSPTRSRSPEPIPRAPSRTPHFDARERWTARRVRLAAHAKHFLDSAKSSAVTVASMRPITLSMASRPCRHGEAGAHREGKRRVGHRSQGADGDGSEGAPRRRRYGARVATSANIGRRPIIEVATARTAEAHLSQSVRLPCRTTVARAPLRGNHVFARIFRSQDDRLTSGSRGRARSKPSATQSESSGSTPSGLYVVAAHDEELLPVSEQITTRSA